jgi:phage I-like protein
MKQIAAFEVNGAVALLYGTELLSGGPSEFRLFGPGITATKKGNFLFDEEASIAVLDAFREQGIDKLPIDVAHGMVTAGGHPDGHRAVGWFTPVVRDDVESGGGLALFASDVEWTARGLEALQAREFRFYSPAINFDQETRRITGLINVALTNIPATKNQRPLVLDALEAQPQKIEESESMKALLETLSASDETGAVVKVGELQAFKSAILSALDSPVEKAAEKIAELSQLAASAIEAKAEVEALKAEKASALKLAKLDALTRDGKLPPAQREFAASLSDSQLDQFVATLSSVIGRAVEEKPDHSKVETLSAEERKIAEMLGLSEDAMKENV